MEESQVKDEQKKLQDSKSLMQEEQEQNNLELTSKPFTSSSSSSLLEEKEISLSPTPTPKCLHGNVQQSNMQGICNNDYTKRAYTASSNSYCKSAQQAQKPLYVETDKTSLSNSISDYTDDRDEDEDDNDNNNSSDDDDNDDEELQENWLKFREFVVNGLDDHHIMVVRGFRRVIAIGTNQGTVALIDVNSNRLVRIYHNHVNPVADIVADVALRYIASCDKAGTIVIQHLRHGKDCERWELANKSIQSVTIHPRYYKTDDAPIIFASGDEVVLLTKSLLLFNRRRETVLFSQMSKVVQVRWSSNSNLIAWASERGVFVYHYRDRCVLHQCNIDAHLTSARFGLYPCSLIWESPTHLICGWGNWIVEVEVTRNLEKKQELRQAGPSKSLSPSQPQASTNHAGIHVPTTNTNNSNNNYNTGKQNIIVRTHSPLCLPSEAESPFRVCGIAPFDASRFVCLAATLQEHEEHNSGSVCVQEGIITELEVRVVERDTLEDCYRGRLDICPPHPLQLGLALVSLRNNFSATTNSRNNNNNNNNNNIAKVATSSKEQNTDTLVTQTTTKATSQTNMASTITTSVNDENMSAHSLQNKLSSLPLERMRNKGNMEEQQHQLAFSSSAIEGSVTGDDDNEVANNNNKIEETEQSILSSPEPTKLEQQQQENKNEKEQYYKEEHQYPTSHHNTTIKDKYNTKTHTRTISSERESNRPVLTESDPSLSLLSDDPLTISQLTNDDVWDDSNNEDYYYYNDEHIESQSIWSHAQNRFDSSGSNAGQHSDDISHLRSHARNPLCHIGSSPSEWVYIIHAADAIIQSTRCDHDDHVDYLIETNKMEEAYEFVRTHSSFQRHTRQSIAQCLISYYFHKACYDKFIPRMPQLLEEDYVAWEYWVAQLNTKHEAWRLVTVLPTRDECIYYSSNNSNTVCHSSSAPHGERALDATASQRTPHHDTSQWGIATRYYDAVLLSCLEFEPVLLSSAVRRYYMHFNLPLITNAVAKVYLDCCASNENQLLSSEQQTHQHEEGSNMLPTKESLLSESPHYTELESKSTSQVNSPHHLTHFELQVFYGEVYSYLLQLQHKNEEALHVLLHIKSVHSLFKLIRSAELYKDALELLPELFTRSPELTLELLLEHALSTSHITTITTTASSSAAATAVGGGSAEQLDKLAPSIYLTPERVIAQLQHTDRIHLLQYFQAIQVELPGLYNTLARRHAQLIALLLIDYDRSSLLAFLREMSMYLERIREIYVLCKKYDMIEEMVLLMSRMGRDEEAINVIVTRLHNVRKALYFILEIPSLNEQKMLFHRLVRCTIAHHASLPVWTRVETNQHRTDHLHGQFRIRYFEYTLQASETWEHVARKFHIDVHELMECNEVSETESTPLQEEEQHEEKTKRRRDVAKDIVNVGDVAYITTINTINTENTTEDKSVSCETLLDKAKNLENAAKCIKVPINLLSELLQAVSEPPFVTSQAIDTAMLLHELPNKEIISHATEAVSKLTNARADEAALLIALVNVAEADLTVQYGKLLRAQTAGFVLQPQNDLHCAFCGQVLEDQYVAFACHHCFHDSCVLSYLASADWLTVPPSTIDVKAFMQSPLSFVKPQLLALRSTQIPYCNVCFHQRHNPRRHRHYY